MILLEKWVIFCEGICCVLIVNVILEKFVFLSGILLDMFGVLVFVECFLIFFVEEIFKWCLFLRFCFFEDDGVLRRWILFFLGLVRFVESGEDDWNELLKKVCEGFVKKVIECEIWVRVYSFWFKFGICWV